MDAPAPFALQVTPWNKGRLVGPKPPLRLKEISAIRIRLQLGERIRDLALFNLGLDSKLRACDLVSLRVADITVGSRVASRATVFQRKTNGRCNSSLPSTRGTPYPLGSPPNTCALQTISFQAGCIRADPFQGASTVG